MSKKLKLTKIELETQDGKKVELSIAEAKELHDQLHDLFGDKFVPTTPIIIERDRCWPHWPYTHTPVWYSSSQAIGAPQDGAMDVQCKIESVSGLGITYSGNAA